MLSEKRLFELDALRVLGILLIIFAHIPYYITNRTFVAYHIAVNNVFAYGFFGLSIFFFASGYLLHSRYGFINSRSEAIDFLKKRVIRIYPLYWLSIAAFLVTGIIARDVPTVLTLVVGAQGLFSPQIGYIFALWFVGVLLLYYLLWPLIAVFSRNILYMMSVLIAIFVIFAILRTAFHIVEFRFFTYYWIFAAGIIASKYDVLNKLSARKYAVLYAGVFLPVGLLITHIAGTAMLSRVLVHWLSDSVTPLTLTTTLGILLISAVGLLFVIFTFLIAHLSLSSLSKRGAQLLTALALASYSVYLFHMPFLATLSHVLGYTHIATFLQYFIILCSIPALFVLGFAIQLAETDVIRVLAGHFSL